MADSSAAMTDLYNQRILALAAAIPLTERLSDPQQTVSRRSPLCGSTVTVDVDFEDGKIARFGQDVKACVLGQSSASIFASHVVGMDRAQVEALRQAVLGMLQNDGPVPQAPFADYEVLQNARAYPNRHASILLALDAVLDAFKQNGL